MLRFFQELSRSRPGSAGSQQSGDAKKHEVKLSEKEKHLDTFAKRELLNNHFNG